MNLYEKLFRVIKRDNFTKIKDYLFSIEDGQAIICEDVINLYKKLFEAISQGDLYRVRSCLNKGAYVSTIGKFDETPLYLATKHGHVNIVELLLERGANVNLLNNDNRTPLYEAVWLGHTSIVEMLLKKNANFGNSNTPPYIANKTYDVIIELLKEAGHNIECIKKVGYNLENIFIKTEVFYKPYASSYWCTKQNLI